MQFLYKTSFITVILVGGLSIQASSQSAIAPETAHAWVQTEDSQCFCIERDGRSWDFPDELLSGAKVAGVSYVIHCESSRYSLCDVLCCRSPLPRAHIALSSDAGDIKSFEVLHDYGKGVVLLQQFHDVCKSSLPENFDIEYDGVRYAAQLSPELRAFMGFLRLHLTRPSKTIA